MKNNPNNPFEHQRGGDMAQEPRAAEKPETEHGGFEVGEEVFVETLNGEKNGRIIRFNTTRLKDGELAVLADEHGHTFGGFPIWKLKRPDSKTETMPDQITPARAPATENRLKGKLVSFTKKKEVPEQGTAKKHLQGPPKLRRPGHKNWEER